ncbi:C3a anaphylatoxin chemotactic receptor-like [Pyxicephalus adspersus]|uniref:C3a anaphylatoxin chemotactic receptor-like n=1 Tax=Pyxicephalus adspersus TaxID=30357 RepID=UPI003B59B2DE
MSTFSNDSDSQPQFYSHKHVFTILVLAVTTLVGVPGNALVLWVSGVKMDWTVTTIWFGNLALADITCCLCLPFSVAQIFYSDWLYGSALCRILPFIVTINMYASVFTLVTISIDRWILVSRPVWAKKHRKIHTAWMICLAIWISSFLMCLPVVIYQRTVTSSNKTFCYSEDPTTVPVTLAHATFGFLIPLIIISACYIHLAFKAQRIRFVEVGKKATRVAISIIIVFFLTWVPFHIVSVLLLYKKSEALDILDLFSKSLAQFNSCINPIRYVFMGKDMKQRVKQSVYELVEHLFREDLLSASDSSRTQNEEGSPVEVLSE